MDHRSHATWFVRLEPDTGHLTVWNLAPIQLALPRIAHSRSSSAPLEPQWCVAFCRAFVWSPFCCCRFNNNKKKNNPIGKFNRMKWEIEISLTFCASTFGCCQKRTFVSWILVRAGRCRLISVANKINAFDEEKNTVSNKYTKKSNPYPAEFRPASWRTLSNWALNMRWPSKPNAVNSVSDFWCWSRQFLHYKYRSSMRMKTKISDNIIRYFIIRLPNVLGV